MQYIEYINDMKVFVYCNKPFDGLLTDEELEEIKNNPLCDKYGN